MNPIKLDPIKSKIFEQNNISFLKLLKMMNLMLKVSQKHLSKQKKYLIWKMKTLFNILI